MNRSINIRIRRSSSQIFIRSRKLEFQAHDSMVEQWVSLFFSVANKSADYFHRYRKNCVYYNIIPVTFNLINVNHVNCRPKKRKKELPASVKGRAITPRCDVSDSKRERENLLVLIGRAITKTKMRERERERGKINNCRGIKGEGQVYVKEESKFTGAFERNDPLVACEPPFFATFSIYAYSENSFHSFFRARCKLQFLF